MTRHHSPWPLLVLASAATLSSTVDAFAHQPSPVHHSSMIMHYRVTKIHQSSTIENEEMPPLDVVSEFDIVASSEEIQDRVTLESIEVGTPLGVMPFAPMMTFQKYLTMQEKRVKVTIRYSADAGLRPFYLTVASRIKSAHPDIILEKRILPNPTGSSDITDSVFEVLVDGKIVVGKKKTKLLKVRTSSSSSSRSGEDDDDNNTNDKNEATDSDIAGGRSIFVSMEKLEQELNKARKKRRPSTMYKSKELLRDGVDSIEMGESGDNDITVSGTSEAVLRLEKLKALSVSSRKN